MNAPVQAPNTLKAKLLTDLMCSEHDADHVVDLDASFFNEPESSWAEDINKALDVAIANLGRILPLLESPARLEQMEQHITASIDEILVLQDEVTAAVTEYSDESITSEAKWRTELLQELCNMVASIDAGTPAGQAELRGVQKTLEVLNLTRG